MVAAGNHRRVAFTGQGAAFRLLHQPPIGGYHPLQPRPRAVRQESERLLGEGRAQIEAGGESDDADA